jgi:hypothetical protein
MHDDAQLASAIRISHWGIAASVGGSPRWRLVLASSKHAGRRFTPNGRKARAQERQHAKQKKAEARRQTA